MGCLHWIGECGAQFVYLQHAFWAQNLLHGLYTSCSSPNFLGHVVQAFASIHLYQHYL